ncbi:YchJ family protein [Halopseudomonas pelagia]|uniref:YchJ family protein n=1 Tax=Halopseudomonas pelagia TaxID=553151 RepID=UPI0030DB06AA
MQGSSSTPTPSECPCGTGKQYHECCQPLHTDAPALDAEQLMRSRYSAYALGLVDYLVSSTLPAQQSLLDYQAMAQWSSTSTWLGLDVEAAPPVDQHAQRAQVTFAAHWADPDGQRHSHRECSDFVRKQDRWFFIDPNHPIQAGRNDPCPCGSGKKFKQCCSL